MSAFFFQAEDGIRDYKVTGVQTCALPISSEYTATDLMPMRRSVRSMRQAMVPRFAMRTLRNITRSTLPPALDCRRYTGCRSEERRVGKECRFRWEAERARRNGRSRRRYDY